VLAATFVALPFFVLVAEAALRQVDTRYDEVAATLGASRWFTFRRVTLPMMAPGLAAGAVLAWARALGEFGATLTFAGNVEGETRTLPLAIYLELDTNASGAVALSLLLLAVAVVVVVALRGRWWNES
jgi:molybdate transport system permease protein